MTINDVVVPPTAGATMAMGAVLPPICALVVAMRFLARYRQSAGYKLDDWLTVPALIFTIGMGACLVVGVNEKALGHPTPQPPPGIPANLFRSRPTTVNRQIEYYLELLQFPAITCVKLSFLFFYKRVFCTRSTRVLNIIIWVMFAVCIIWGVAFFFGLMFICGANIPMFWSHISDVKKYCGPLLDHQYWLGITDFVIDAIIFIIPIPLIWRLQLSVARKLAITGVFLLGALTLAASITRMIIFVRAVQELRKQYVSGGANNLTITAGLYWCTFETGAGLIAVCLPSCYGLLASVCASTFGLLSGSSQGESWKTRSIRLSNQRRCSVSGGSESQIFPPPLVGNASIDCYATKDQSTMQANEMEHLTNRILVRQTVSQAERVI